MKLGCNVSDPTGNLAARSVRSSGRRVIRSCLMTAVALTLTIPVTACATSGDASPQSRQEAAFGQDVDAIVEGALKAGNYPGVEIAILKGGELVEAKGYGLANVETGEKVNADTVFPIGSISKSFTGLAVAQLAAKGKVDLDASISRYIDGLPSGWEAIKVRNLMDHTAGIFNYTEDKSIQAAPGQSRNFAEMRAIWEAHPLRFEPGTRWSYSNSGYFLLGMIVERTSGLSYGDYVTRNIIKPLGLKHTSFPKVIQNKPGAKGYAYVKGEQKLMPDWAPGIPYSAGAILSTAGDIAKYIDAIHHSGKVSEAVRKILYTQDIAGGEKMTYALGGLSIQPVEGRLRVSHPGSIWGYTSFFAYYPKERVSVVVLSNSHNSPIHPSNIERKLERVALGEPQPEYADVALTNEVSAAVTGDYSTGAMEFISSNISFVNRDGMIYLVFGGAKHEIFSFPMRYVGNGLFVAYHDDELTVRFDTVTGKAKTADLVMFGGQMQARR